MKGYEMTERIPIIKAKFEMVKIVLGNDFNSEDLRHPKYQSVLINALENTYLHLNDDICESLLMCQECAQKRDAVLEYINLIDTFQENADDTVHSKLEKLPVIIDEVIERIDKVLRELTRG